VDRKLAEAFHALGLIIIFLAIAPSNPAVGTCMLLLAATMGDIRVVRKGASSIRTKAGLLGRTLRRVAGQIIVLTSVVLDIAGLGFAVTASVWLGPWIIINLTMLVLGILTWSERRREAQRQQQIDQADRLRQAEQRLREVEQLRYQEEEERKAQRRQQAEQAERLCHAEQRLRELEQLRLQQEDEREAERQQQAEQAERLRQAEQQLREAEWRRRLEKGTHRKRQAQFQADWWIVLGVAPSTSKDEIARNYRRMIKQYHPDRVAGLAPEFLQLAEERTKALNEAYDNAMHGRRWVRAA
jgi:DnaJ-domain-containing protein 1